MQGYSLLFRNFVNAAQVDTSPLSRPRRNHVTRSREEPCVNDSGETVPRAIFCSLSSPTAAAACYPALISASSIMFR
jgi:hypothetical protein